MPAGRLVYARAQDVENQRGIVARLRPATAEAAAAPWERREAGSSRGADHKKNPLCA